MSLTGAVLDRSHVVVPRSRSRAAGPARVSRRGRTLSLLIALALGAGVAVWLIAAAFPGAAVGSAGAGGAASAPVEIVGQGTVVASAACTDPDAQDTIAVDAPGGRRLLPLDACGSIVGAVVTVRMSLDDTGPPVPARMLGTGGDGALTPNGDTSGSPLTGRLAILLTGVAGLGMAGLLVAVARERGRRRASKGSMLALNARNVPRSSGRVVTERRVPGRAERASTVRPSTRSSRRPSATCRTVPAARRPANRPASRRPAPGRRRH